MEPANVSLREQEEYLSLKSMSNQGIQRDGYQNSHPRFGASWDGFREIIYFKQNVFLM